MKKENIIIAAIAGIVVLIFLDKILKAVGLVKTAEDKAEDKAVANVQTLKQFNPLYTEGKPFTPLGDNLAKQYAITLRKAVRGMGTDENAIFTTFAKFYSKANISEVAKQYYIYCGKDMQTDILNDLSDSETLKLNAIINKLPDR